MKILFTGGGTGGHFFPIIAVADAVKAVAEREHIAVPDLYYMSDAPYDAALLERTGLQFIKVESGKQRTYKSSKNFLDVFKTMSGCIAALFRIFMLYPDVIFGKGGYASFPAIFAARILRVPVVIHESDVIPGKVNRWVGNYAAKIALSYPEAVKYFKHKDRVAYTGQPILNALLEVPTEDAFTLLALEPDVPVMLVVGGSQGAERINEELIDILPKLLEHYQVIHQTGENNFDWIKKRAAGVLTGNPHADRYRPFAFLETHQLRISAKASSLVISRAGSMIFEIAIWEKPCILIPLAIARDDHQRENAYSYARTGAATIIEEQNLKPELFISVIQSIMNDPNRQQAMIEGAKNFTKVDAAEKIATLLLSIGSRHE